MPEAMVDRVTGISRRAFLAGAAGVATVAAIAVLPLATAERAAALVSSSATLKRSRFTPLLHATFRMVDASGRSINVVLAEIADLRPASAPGSETCFSLVFDGPKASPLAGGTYRFRHSAIGEVSLFVVPIDRGVKAAHYQAVINQG